MEKKWDVYVYGDVNIDLVVPGVDALPDPGTEADVPVMETFVGGGAALFALGVAKLGLVPVFQGSVGRDMYGAYIRSLFRELGADDSLLSDSDTKKTGISISFTNERDRCFLTYRGTNEGLSLRHMDLEQVKYARHVHVTGYEGTSNHEEYLGMLKKIKALPGVTVSFDVGWDMTGAWYEGIFELLPMIDVLFMNETECCHYTRCSDPEEGARKLAQSAGMAVIKLGKRGSGLSRHGGGHHRSGGFLQRGLRFRVSGGAEHGGVPEIRKRMRRSVRHEAGRQHGLPLPERAGTVDPGSRMNKGWTKT